MVFCMLPILICHFIRIMSIFFNHSLLFPLFFLPNCLRNAAYGVGSCFLKAPLIFISSSATRLRPGSTERKNSVFMSVCLSSVVRLSVRPSVSLSVCLSASYRPPRSYQHSSFLPQPPVPHSSPSPKLKNHAGS